MPRLTGRPHKNGVSHQQPASQQSFDGSWLLWPPFLGGGGRPRFRHGHIIRTSRPTLLAAAAVAFPGITGSGSSSPAKSNRRPAAFALFQFLPLPLPSQFIHLFAPHTFLATHSLFYSSSSSAHCQRSFSYKQIQLQRSSTARVRSPPTHKMRALHFLLLLLAVPLLMVAASPMFDTDMPQGRFYRALWNMNPKRSPSIGLSLAEYMAAGNQGHDQFHFIPSRK